MAEVFEALLLGEAGFERRVVLKRLALSGPSDPEAQRAFIDEARILSRLHHPGIVSVLDFGGEEERPFQILERVDGPDLATLMEQHLRGSPLPLEIAVGVALEVAEALDYAHRAPDSGGKALGLIHRDVAPDNILLAWSGEVKLADFGIAWARERLARTKVGVAKGKLEFMSPEQALGGEVDARSDLYSLAVVLLQAVLGRNPLSDPALRKQVWAGAPLPLAEVADRALATLLERATKHRPGERYPDAGSLAAGLAQLLEARRVGDPLRARRRWLEGVRPAAAAAVPVARRPLSQLLGAGGLLDVVPPDDAAALGPEQIETEVQGPITEPTRLPAEPLDPTPALLPTVPRGDLTPALTVPRVDRAPVSPVGAKSWSSRIRPELVAGLVLLVSVVVLYAAISAAPRKAKGPTEAASVPTASPGVAAISAPSLAPQGPSLAPAGGSPPPVPGPEPLSGAIAPADPVPPRPSRPSAAPRRSDAQLRAELESKLVAKAAALGLAQDELSELEGLGTNLKRYTALLAADPLAAEAEWPTLEAAIDRGAPSQALLARHLERARGRLAAAAKSLTPEALRRLDGQYLDLQAALRADPGTRERARLLAAIHRLEQTLKGS